MNLRFLAVLFVLPYAAFAQDSSTVRVAVAVVVAAQPDAPVHVVSIERQTLPMPVAQFEPDPLVTVENASSRPVVAVQVLTATAAPNGCSPAPQNPMFSQKGGGNDSLDARVEIAPHSMAKLRAVGLYSEAQKTTAMKSRYLQVQLAVQRVEFADGTSWVRPVSERIDRGLLQVDSGKCADWPWIEGRFGSVDSIKLSGPAKGAAPIKGERYTFFCDIKGDTAFCLK